MIVSPLGEGGMGQVYLARDTRLQRSVALKILQPQVEGEAGAQSGSNGAARLLREAQAAAALEHPNVVTIYEVGKIQGEGDEAGRPFIAMELVKGKALRAFVGDESVPIQERVRWLVDAARALGAAHRAGLVHRDIKPENVMVREDGVVKVLDFGLAKRAASGSTSQSSSTEAQVLPSLTGKGIAIGTPYYMAPEQMRREPLDGRADQFAWGVVAYELLSGTPAWGRDVDALELVSKLLSYDPTPLADARPDVPAHVSAAVTRAMAKRKGARFETMDALVTALEESAAPAKQSGESRDDAARVAGPAGDGSADGASEKRAPRMVPPRRSLVAVVGGAAIVVSMLGGGTALYLRSRSAARVEAPVASAPLPATGASFPDFGSTMSKIPEATAAYRKGMQAFRDADAEGGARELARALELDPDFAAAQLRQGLRRIPPLLKDREHLQRAVRVREGLGPHDRTLLDAIVPLLDVPQSFVEASKRLAAAFEQAPTDADFALVLCRAREAAGDFHGARDACGRARELDPAAAAIREDALVQERLDDVPRALASFDACLRASPLATSCLEPLFELQAFEGKCTDALATARRLVSIDPGSADAYDRLAIALTGAGEPIDSVHLVLAQKLEHLSPEDAKVAKLRDAAMLDVMTGDFADADLQLRAWDAAESSSRFEGDHQVVSYARAALAAEVGNTRSAVALLAGYLKQRPSWTLGSENDFSMDFVATLYALGGLPRDEFVAKRTKWLADQRQLASSQFFPWVDAYAIPALSEADAREALDALPMFNLPDPLNGTPEWEWPIGRTYRLAGRDSEALPFLSHAVRACVLLENPFEQTLASFDLGAALEKVGQVAAACDAYRVVVQRWGRAPASVTAAKARERLTSLRCSAR